MAPLRIVVVMAEPPLPFGNAAARWFYVLLRGLVERGHRVTAYSACSQASQLEQARELFPSPRYDLRMYPIGGRRGLLARWDTVRRPFSYLFSDDLRRDLDGVLARGFDVLHLEQLWTGWLGVEHSPRALVNVHYLASIDLGAMRPATLDEWKTKLLSRRAERVLLRSLHHVCARSPRLVEPIRRINPRADVTEVPLGIDHTLYDYIPDARRANEPTVTLIGTMSWYPSRSAAVRLLTRLWPEIRRRVPRARLQIVGWEARARLAEYLDLPGVTVEENVPDARPFFERTSVLLYAPSRGSGMKIKVLEAMAYGVPVVTTSEGDEGLPAVDGVHAGVCEDDAGLIDRAVALLEDPARQDRQRFEARRLLEANCGPAPTLDAIESVYRKMLSVPATDGIPGRRSAGGG